MPSIAGTCVGHNLSTPVYFCNVATYSAIILAFSNVVRSGTLSCSIFEDLTPNGHVSLAMSADMASAIDRGHNFIQRVDILIFPFDQG